MFRYSFCCLPRRGVIAYPGLAADIWRYLLFSKNPISGECIERFENAFADKTGVKYAIAVGSGRIALVCILQSLGLAKGDEVMLSAYNFPQLIPLIQSLSLKPVFVDIERESLDLNIKQLKNKISTRTKVILVTHFFGQAADLDSIREIARDNNIYLIEDCAHSCGAEYKHRKVGSIGDAGFFSFPFSKPLNTFFGGMITTDNALIARRAREIVTSYSFPAKSELIREVLKVCAYKILLNRKVYTLYAWPAIFVSNLLSASLDPLRIRRIVRYRGGELANKELRLSNFQGIVGMKQLKRLEEINEERRKRVEFLKSMLRPDIGMQKVLINTKPIYLFVLFTCTNRNKAIRRLIARGIDVDIGFMSNCARITGEGEYPYAEYMANNAFMIHISHDFPFDGLRRVSSILNSILG